MTHRGPLSRLVSLSNWIRQSACLRNLFFRRMCMRICYVPFCCQPHHSCRTIQISE
ncbi:hypothetical protein G4228_015819 [Cervus hanglu yarkandensis]|nr:hypothetical protein G4228_015819 [Cervus hanglu yarkandensis]